MKKQFMITVAVVVLSVAGCKDKPKETPHTAIPQSGVSSRQIPAATPGQNNPHAVRPPAQPAAGHKGKVVSTMNADGNTYMEVEENGRKIWAAVKETKITVGDEVEFPNSPTTQNFTSKTLNRTFDKIFFVSRLRVNGK